MVSNFGKHAVLKTKMSQSAELGSTSLSHQLHPPSSSPHFDYFLFIVFLGAVGGLLFDDISIQMYVELGDHKSLSCSSSDVLHGVKFRFRNVPIVGVHY